MKNKLKYLYNKTIRKDRFIGISSCVYSIGLAVLFLIEFVVYILVAVFQFVAFVVLFPFCFIYNIADITLGIGAYTLYFYKNKINHNSLKHIQDRQQKYMRIYSKYAINQYIKHITKIIHINENKKDNKEESEQ